MSDWSDPNERESAIAAKWAEAEDRIRVLETHIAELEAALSRVSSALKYHEHDEYAVRRPRRTGEEA